MEEALTDCVVPVKEDLSQLQKARDYLRKNAETEEGCSFTWRTIEAFNSVLSICSSQNTPENRTLDLLLDNFYCLARNNTDSSVWQNFGFELGIICTKILSAIERSDVFEVLFSKLLSVISLICKHDSGIWKAAARQILNFLINKKFSLRCLEDILKSYIYIIRNVERFDLHDFSLQNIGLLKMLSFLVQRVGDYEIQSDIVEVIFLHLSNDTKLMSGFFTTTKNKFFHSLQFNDFEGDCRLFLNALNKQRCEPDKKVYSICCRSLRLGDCFVEPPIGRNYIWMDANKDSERVSFKCGDVASNENRVINIWFSELVNVHFDNEKTESGSRLIIQTKSLEAMEKYMSSNDICVVVENLDGMPDFVGFLEEIICKRKRKKHGKKASKTVDCLFIDMSPEEVQDIVIASSNSSGVNRILPDDFFLTEKANRNTEKKNKAVQPSKAESSLTRTPKQSRKASEEQKTVFGSQELSPNSFVESLDKHLGLDSLEPRHTSEDNAQTVEFLQKGNVERSHKLFRDVNKIFNKFETNTPESFTFIFDRDKENQSPADVAKQKIKAHERSSQKTPRVSVTSVSQVSRTVRQLRSQNRVDAELTNNQSQDCFRGSSNIIMKKKPCLPKLKRTEKTMNKKVTNEENKNSPALIERTNSKVFLQNNGAINQAGGKKKARSETMEIQEPLKEGRKFKGRPGRMEGSPCSQGSIKKEGKEKPSNGKMKVLQRKETHHQQSEPKSQRKVKGQESLKDKDVGRESAQTSEAKGDAKPSLLDPNGYCYKRWCEPTKSERSNFWLKKLSALKTAHDTYEHSDVFDFGVSKSKEERKIVLSKRSFRTAGTRSRTLRQVKEFLKKVRPPEKKNPRICFQAWSPEPSGSPGSFPRTEDPLNFHSDFIHKRSLIEKNAQDEDSSEDEELWSKTREMSDEDRSMTRASLKKKPKTTFSDKFVLSTFRHRFQKVEERDRRQTDKIIQTVHETFSHLVNCLQTNREKAKEYLKEAEEAAADAEAKVQELNLLEKRTRRAVLYLKEECSVSSFCGTSEEHFSRARDSLRAPRAEEAASGAVERVGDRLRGLIRSEMEKAFNEEWMSQRDRLLRISAEIHQKLDHN